VNQNDTRPLTCNNLYVFDWTIEVGKWYRINSPREIISYHFPVGVDFIHGFITLIYKYVIKPFWHLNHWISLHLRSRRFSIVISDARVTRKDTFCILGLTCGRYHQHSKITFVSKRCHVTSSISPLLLFGIQLIDYSFNLLLPASPRMVGYQSVACNSSLHVTPVLASRLLCTNPTPLTPPSHNVVFFPRRGQLYPP